MKKSHSIDMCSGSLADKILLFALPLMASSLLQLLFNAADVVVVGRFVGKEALAAVGSNGALINLMVNLFVGLSVGANVVVARELGAGRQEDVRRSVHTSIALAGLSGVILMVLGAVLARQLLTLMSSPEDVIELSSLYLRIYFLGMPANMLYNFGAAILRAQGDTRRPLYFLSIAGVVNVCLNLVFVIVFHMSVAGVALATIAAQYISAVLVLLCLMRDEGPLHLELKALCLDKQVVKKIVRVGFPAGFQGMLFSLSNVVIQSTINSFGSVVVAGSAASSNIEGFVYAGMNAVYQTALTFVSQNYGAGECKRVDRISVLCLSYTTVIGLFLGGLAVIFGGQLAAIYAPGDPAVIAAAEERMMYVCTLYFICGLMDTMVGILRGLGHSVVPMIISLVGACGLRLLWIAFVFPFFRTPAALYISYPVSWVVTTAMHVIFFFMVRKHAYIKVRHETAQQ